ncbi:unnamed protein product [Mucor hiemalis]
MTQWVGDVSTAGKTVGDGTGDAEASGLSMRVVEDVAIADEDTVMSEAAEDDSSLSDYQGHSSVLVTDENIDREIDRDLAAGLVGDEVVVKDDAASCIANVTQSIALAEQEIAELTIQVGLHLSDDEEFTRLNSRLARLNTGLANLNQSLGMMRKRRNDSWVIAEKVPQKLPKIQWSGQVFDPNQEVAVDLKGAWRRFEDVLGMHALDMDHNWRRLITTCLGPEHRGWLDDELSSRVVSWVQFKTAFCKAFGVDGARERDDAATELRNLNIYLAARKNVGKAINQGGFKKKTPYGSKTKEQLDELRRKGLCFTCSEPYQKGNHQCAGKTGPKKFRAMRKGAKGKIHQSVDKFLLESNSSLSNNSSYSYVPNTLEGNQVFGLVDSAASFSAIKPCLFDLINKPLKHNDEMISLADKSTVKSNGEVQDVDILYNGIQLKHDFELFDFDSDASVCIGSDLMGKLNIVISGLATSWIPYEPEKEEPIDATSSDIIFSHNHPYGSTEEREYMMKEIQPLLEENMKIPITSCCTLPGSEVELERWMRRITSIVVSIVFLTPTPFPSMNKFKRG